jgi:hypothetical protein
MATVIARVYALFGFGISTGSRINVALGYGLAAVLMVGGAVCEYFIGAKPQGKSLEQIATPLRST